MSAIQTHTFSELGTKVIDLGLADPVLSRFYNSVQSAKPGKVTEAIKPYMPLLSLCSDSMSSLAPPPIFYVGKESGQRKLFGDDWAHNSRSDAALRTPDQELENASADGYRKALERGIYYGYARTEVSVGDVTYEVAFERLILAIRPTLKSDYRFCAYLGIIQELQRKP